MRIWSAATRLGLPSRIKSWPLTSLQHRLMKTGGRLVKHARYYWLLLAEGHLNRRLFGEMLARLAALPVPGGVMRPARRQPELAVAGRRLRSGLGSAGAYESRCPRSARVGRVQRRQKEDDQ